MAVGDLDDIFVPLPEDLLVNLSESRSVVDAFLDSLPSMFQDYVNIESAFRPALKEAFIYGYGMPYIQFRDFCKADQLIVSWTTLSWRGPNRIRRDRLLKLNDGRRPRPSLFTYFKIQKLPFLLFNHSKKKKSEIIYLSLAVHLILKKCLPKITSKSLDNQSMIGKTKGNPFFFFIFFFHSKCLHRIDLKPINILHSVIPHLRNGE